MISGCAYLNPYVEAYPKGVPSVTVSTLPRTGEAINLVDGWAQAVEQKRRDTSLAQRSLNIATFGLAAGAAIAPIYNAYKDASSALALGAGTAYTGNALFFSSDQISLYGAAAVSLVCIQQRGGALVSALSPEGSAAELRSRFILMLQGRPPACLATPEYTKLKVAFDSAYVSMQRVEGSDESAAIKLRQAGQNVVIALNQEIDKRAPTPEAIFAAARSLASFAPVTTAAPKLETPRELGVCPDEEKAFLVSQTGFYEQKQKVADRALDGVNGLDTACVFNAPAIPDLTVDQDKIVLVAEAKVNISVRGGRPPYHGTWDIDPASAGVILSQPTPDVFMVQGISGIKEGSYKLTIRDSSASGTSKVVTVTAKAKT
jgi:hypothetical protein